MLNSKVSYILLEKIECLSSGGGVEGRSENNGNLDNRAMCVIIISRVGVDRKNGGRIKVLIFKLSKKKS